MDYSSVITVFSVSCLFGTKIALCQSDVPDIFLDFGEHVGDVTMVRDDDDYTDAISIATNFSFFATTYTDLFVSMNFKF